MLILLNSNMFIYKVYDQLFIIIVMICNCKDARSWIYEHLQYSMHNDPTHFTGIDSQNT